MDDPERRDTSSSDQTGDGVRITRHEGADRRVGLLYKLLAFLLVAGSAVFLLTRIADPQDNEHRNARQDVQNTDHAAAMPSALSDTTNAPRRDVTTRPIQPTQSVQPGREPTGDLADYVLPGEAPSAAEVIERLNQAGIHSGIGAFSPPGTSPPLVGLAVPEDFSLPEGYVRHYQATDDGQRINPILMFSPDFEFFDASGRPIKIPENRVVPPELAPPGLPIRLIEIPKPVAPGGP